MQNAGDEHQALRARACEVRRHAEELRHESRELRRISSSLRADARAAAAVVAAFQPAMVMEPHHLTGSASTLVTSPS